MDPVSGWSVWIKPYVPLLRGPAQLVHVQNLKKKKLQLMAHGGGGLMDLGTRS
jgi:hypothetical protein